MSYLLIGAALGFLAILPVILGELGIWFTKVEEGQIKVVILGGNAVRYIGVIQGYKCDSDTGEITEKDTHKPSRGWFGYGYHFMHWSPWAKVHKYEFKWPKLIEKKGGGYEVELRDEEVDSLFHRYQYPVVADDIKTFDQVQIKVIVLVMLQATDASLALFPLANWLAVASGHIRSVVRSYAGKTKYQKIASGENEELVEAIMALSRMGPGKTLTKEERDKTLAILGASTDDDTALKTLVGTEVISAAVVETPPKTTPELEAALTAKKVAREHAYAEIITAKGHAIAKRAGIEAEINRVEKVYGAIIAVGSGGPQIRMAEAIEDTEVKTLVLGSGAAVTLPLTPHST